MDMRRKHSKMIFFVFSLLFLGFSGLFSASDAYSASSPTAYFQSQKLVYDAKSGWKLEGQIVNNSQTHQIVRTDYRKISYTVDDRMGGSEKNYFEENRNVNPVVVPPMGVKKWTMYFGKSFRDHNRYKIKVKKVDMKFSYMPAAKSGGGSGGKTIIIN